MSLRREKEEEELTSLLPKVDVEVGDKSDDTLMMKQSPTVLRRKSWSLLAIWPLSFLLATFIIFVYLLSIEESGKEKDASLADVGWPFFFADADPGDLPFHKPGHILNGKPAEHIFL